MIREAQLADIPVLVALGALFHSQTVLADLLPYDAPSVQRLLEDALQNEAYAVFVMTDAEEITGMICGALVPLYWNTRMVVGQQLAWFVRPSRRCGLVSVKLLSVFEDWALEHGAAAVFSGAKNDEGAQGMDKLLTRRGYINLESMYLKARSY
jgi:hypothetical protein